METISKNNFLEKRHVISLKENVKITIFNYLKSIQPRDVVNLYSIIINEVEEPMLQAIMKYTNQNQSRAALFLGLSRSTLRKKLEFYDIITTGNKD